MDWNKVLPRFQRLLIPEGYLAIIQHDHLPDTWDPSLRSG